LLLVCLVVDRDHTRHEFTTDESQKKEAISKGSIKQFQLIKLTNSVFDNNYKHVTAITDKVIISLNTDVKK
jgi:hypothetical protein